MSWRIRLANLLRRDVNLEIDEELQFHLDSRVRDNIASGMTPDEARRDAYARFGSRPGIREQTRDADILVGIETIGQDLRFAARGVRKRPGFALVAILTLALGIGANTTILTLVRSVLLRPLPFPQSDDLYTISYARPGAPFWLFPGLADTQYLAFRQQNRTFGATATFAVAPLTLTGVGDAVRVDVATVTPDFFRVLRVNPQVGSGFAENQDHPGLDHVVVLADGLWRSRFGGDPSVVNRPITLDGVAYTVIGVLPAGFAYPAKTEIWTPLLVKENPHLSFTRPVIGRLERGISRAQAQAALDAFARTLPRNPGSEGGEVARVTRLKDAVIGDVRTPLAIFSGAVAFVLLIACANVANLLLMRAIGRRQEIATRLAIGASRTRLVRQLLTESALLSLVGGMAGLLIARVGTPALLALMPSGTLPRDAEIHLDLWVFGVTLALSVATGVVLGLVPALQATRYDLSTTLRAGVGSATRRSLRFRHTLIVAEMALALVLLVGAGLLARSFLALRAVDPGFQPAHVMTMTLDLPAAQYPTVAALNAFYERLLASLSRLPDVQAAGAINWLPLGDMWIRGDLQLEGREPPHEYPMKAAVSPTYFRAMGIRFVRGRDFTAQDGARATRVAIVSDSLARLIWPHGDAIGRRLAVESHDDRPDWLTVIGVVDDVRQEGLKHATMPAVYQPYQQVSRTGWLSRMTFIVRTASDPEKLAPTMRTVLASIDTKQAPHSIATMEEVLARTMAEPRFQTRVLGVFSIIALLLAAVGVYGVLAASVAERRREIGIRMALGADRTSVTRLIMGRTLMLTSVGLLLGIAGALALTSAMARLLFNVTPTDTRTFAGAAAILLCAGLVAGLLPARRASAVDPLTVLRTE
jgi:predicted permease